MAGGFIFEKLMHVGFLLFYMVSFMIIHKYDN